MPCVREDLDPRQSETGSAQEHVMTHSHRVLGFGIAWMLTAVVLFLTVGTMSFLGLALLAVGGLVPPLVYLALSGGPTATMAEVLHDAEQGKSVR
jgi:hypothetical protein